MDVVSVIHALRASLLDKGPGSVDIRDIPGFSAIRQFIIGESVSIIDGKNFIAVHI